MLLPSQFVKDGNYGNLKERADMIQQNASSVFN